MRGCDTKIKLCFVIFVAWVKKKENPFASDKGCSNFKTTLTRHSSLCEHQRAPQGSAIAADLHRGSCPPVVPICPLPSKGLEGTNCLLRPESWLKPCCLCVNSTYHHLAMQAMARCASVHSEEN